MNIFFLSAHPDVAAWYQCDKHVVKMSLETAQLISTAIHHMPNLDVDKSKIYKPAYVNHPCSVWARKDSNIEWLLLHGYSLCKEYELRYSKRHKSLDVIEYAFSLLKPDLSRSTCKKPKSVVLCMPDQYRPEPDMIECTDLDKAVDAYRSFYRTEKAYFAKWKCNNKPYWW